MERDRWRRVMTGAVVASVLLGLVATGLAIAALNKNPSSTETAGPATSLVAPSSGNTISGTQVLDAKAIGSNVVAVDFLATGGRLHDAKIGTGTASLVGWVSSWNTRTEANGTYSLVSVGYDAQGHSDRSPSVVVTVTN